MPTLHVFGEPADGVQGTESPRNRMAGNFPDAGLKANLSDHRYVAVDLVEVWYFIGLSWLPLG